MPRISRRLQDSLLVDRVLELFDINVEAGIFYRKTSAGSRQVGEVAGAVRPDGYIHLSIDNRHYLAHRILMFMRLGIWPECVDHIDGNKQNNSAKNLRPATISLNGRNQRLGRANKSGVMGVRYRPDKDSYVAYWLDENGVRKQKNFRCDVLGHEGAKQAAAAHRRMMIDMVNEKGAGYSSGHGEAKEP